VGKSSKDKDRRAVVEQIRREQERSEKRRTYAIVAACAVVGLVIVGLTLPSVIKQEKLEGRDLEAIGVSADDAGCQDVEAEPATGSADHQPDGKQIVYDAAPPASGPHYAAAAPMSRKFYVAEDRPPVESLVHNLEHGYSILWYDEVVAEKKEQLAEVKAIGDKFPGASEPGNKFIVAPWTGDDGEPFPEGTHVAITHWSMGDTNGNDEGQQGVSQYCAAPSGEAVSTFVEDYPYSDSPEPNAS